MAVITMRVTEQEKDALQKAAEFNNSKMSTMIKKIVFDYLEDEYDIQAAGQAHKEFTKDSKTYTHKEMKEMLGL